MEEISHMSIKINKKLQREYKSLLATRGMTQIDHVVELIKEAVAKMKKEKIK